MGPDQRPEHGPEPIEAQFRARAVTVSPAGYAQLEAIRDQWLAPLVAQITEQAERIGRLEAERDREELRRQAESLQAERDRLLAEATQSAPPAAPASTREAIGTDEAWKDAEPLWRRVWRTIGGE